MNERPAPARLQSLCGTGRQLKIRNQKKLISSRLPCRPSGLWACIGNPDRPRRLGEFTR